MVEAKTIGITTIFLMLGLGIASVPLGFWDTPHYFCEVKPSLGINTTCDRFSSTGTRCYPMANSTRGYIDCNSGWKKITNDIIVTDEMYTAENYYAAKEQRKAQCEMDGCLSE